MVGNGAGVIKAEISGWLHASKTLVSFRLLNTGGVIATGANRHRFGAADRVRLWGEARDRGLRRTLHDRYLRTAGQCTSGAHDELLR